METIMLLEIRDFFRLVFRFDNTLFSFQVLYVVALDDQIKHWQYICDQSVIITIMFSSFVVTCIITLSMFITHEHLSSSETLLEINSVKSCAKFFS